MKPVFTSTQMRLSEQRLFESGTASIDLMERAARQLSARVLEALPQNGTVAFACGSGGNGGDGYAAARMLAEKGVRTVVLMVSPPKTEDAKTNYALAQSKVFALTDVSHLSRLPKPDVWVDCIFGIGLSRKPEGDAEKLIERINRDGENGSFVISCDIPSGLSADDGSVPGVCVKANETVTFQAAKRGQYLGSGLDVTGSLRVADIGIPEAFYAADAMQLYENEDLSHALPARRKSAHKNDFGHLLVVAGSRGMAGAAAMTAMAALRSGAGLVTVACPDSILDTLQVLVPCAMCVGLSETNGAIDQSALKTLAQALKGKTAVAIGPGLSRRASADCLRLVLESDIKTVLDADALNILSENPDIKHLLAPCHALTPHPGEAARLLGERITDAAECAAKLHEFGCAALLKGASSVVAGKALTLISSGCVGMAKGGSGDALTGIVGGLLAQGLDAEEALKAGAHLHALAGCKAQERFGARAMLPSDLIDCLGAAFKDVEP